MTLHNYPFRYQEVARRLRDEVLWDKERIRQVVDATLQHMVGRDEKRDVVHWISPGQLDFRLYIINAFKGRFILGTWFRDNQGLHFARIDDNNWVTVHRTHLFKRFSSRYFHKKLDPEIAAEQFFFGASGNEFYVIEEDTSLTAIPIVKAVQGGVALGQTFMNHELSIMNTYLPYHNLSCEKMAKYKQHETRDILLERIRLLSPDVLRALFKRDPFS
ncbi:hypothetical protein [Chryseolinea lacunae]|uniref:NERD domain-containing protein n=1 Tax=Chryseolinea lacunae TaxID=2801331 RepID=A0ABS1L2M0_9BACT|nr:hypothetical protein [Chryseolinea lacunae]MBL0745920.1 hypothetical protein [Chryseolinea lacunae]